MFRINGKTWQIKAVRASDSRLMRSDGSITVGMCDFGDKCIYLSENLKGDFLERVLCHELTHAVCMSWGISIPLETEEWLCNFMAEHGKEIIVLLDNFLYSMSMKRVV